MQHLLHKPNIIIVYQLYVHMSNNSGYTINIGATRNMHIRFFFKLHAENKTAQTINHPQQGEMLDPELVTYFSTIEHILAVRSSLKS